VCPCVGEGQSIIIGNWFDEKARNSVEIEGKPERKEVNPLAIESLSRESVREDQQTIKGKREPDLINIKV